MHSCLFTHPTLLNTLPFLCFFTGFSRNVTELYELHNDTYFLSGMSRNLTDYATMPFFDLWNVAELYGLRNNASFRLPTCRGTSWIA